MDREKQIRFIKAGIPPIYKPELIKGLKVSDLYKVKVKSEIYPTIINTDTSDKSFFVIDTRGAKHNDATHCLGYLCSYYFCNNKPCAYITRSDLVALLRDQDRYDEQLSMSIVPALFIDDFSLIIEKEDDTERIELFLYKRHKDRLKTIIAIDSSLSSCFTNGTFYNARLSSSIANFSHTFLLGGTNGS